MFVERNQRIKNYLIDAENIHAENIDKLEVALENKTELLLSALKGKE